jgi:vacuolar-type H+-ATPase catalytic subunit A/Vma1
MINEGIITGINGPVVKGLNMKSFKVNEMVTVGNSKLIGEVVSVEGDRLSPIRNIGTGYCRQHF